MAENGVMMFTPRPYQEATLDAICTAYDQGWRQQLLSLATGTGKTSIAFQIAWKLFNARWNLIDWKSGVEPSRRPRILFLADRNGTASR